MQTDHHLVVHRLLADHAASRPMIAAGTDGAIGRAQCHFDRLGDDDALTLLAEANVALYRLRWALRSGDVAEATVQRAALARIASDWLGVTPLFRVAELFPVEGRS